MTKATGLTVLIPAHNEEATIRGVADAALAHTSDVIVINDGSDDATVARLDGLGVRVIDHARNAGKGTRLAEGLRLAFDAGADHVLTLDADGQHDPADIPAFRDAASAAPGSIVIGQRTRAGGNMPLHRALSIGFGDFFISWATARRMRDCQCGLRLYPRAVLSCLDMADRDVAHFGFETAILLQAAERGIGFERVPIEARYDGFQHRPSHYRPARDTLRIVGVITRFLLSRGLKPKGLLIAMGLLR